MFLRDNDFIVRMLYKYS